MLEALLVAALIGAAALVCGQAVMVIGGRDTASALAPAAGLSVLMVVCGIAVELPGHAEPAALVAGLIVVASAVFLWRRREAIGPLRAGAIACGLVAVAVASIPFIASGRMGILGAGLVNDDMASHLLFAEWIETRVGDTPELIADGYPLGPHAVVAAAAKITGASLVEAFAGLTLALAALTALTAYGALAPVRPLFRAPAALLVTFSYLAAAYLAQGAFKEPMLALLLIAFALGLGELRDAGRRALALRALPLGVIAAGAVYLYSFPGLFWLGGAALAWGAATLLAERRRGEGPALGRRLRAAAPAIAVAVAVPLLAALPEAANLVRFAGFEAFDPEGSGPQVGLGNLRHSISPLEALGVWPSSEFRTTAEDAGAPLLAFYLGGAIALAALAWGLVELVRRRQLALPAALASAALAYLAALLVGTPYTGAKALAVASVPVMLVALAGLLGPRASARSSPGPVAARWALLAAFAAGAAISALLPLRQAPVGPTDHAEQLAELRPLVRDQRVLYLGRESFIAWELLGARLHAPLVHEYNVRTAPSRYPPADAKFDFDAIPPRALDNYPWVLTTRSDYRSEPPASLRPAVTTDDYVLWERIGAVGDRRTLREPLGPGAVLDCSGGSGAARSEGTARVLARDPVRQDGGWEPTANVTQSRPASAELALEPGRWSISLQYASTQPVHLRAPGLDATLPTNLDFRGPSVFWPVGEIEVTRAGPVRFELSVERPPLGGRLLGADSLAYPGPLAAMPLEPGASAPLGGSCGRYVDWFSGGR